MSVHYTRVPCGCGGRPYNPPCRRCGGTGTKTARIEEPDAQDEMLELLKQIAGDLAVIKTRIDLSNL